MRINLNIIFKLVLMLLIGSSLFFTVQVISFKTGLSQGSRGLVIQSGEKVSVKKIIDGDEVAVSRGDDNFVVRILGIRSYDPTINDFQLQNAGQLAYTWLEESLLGKEVEVRFQKMQLDKKKRLLAYIHFEEKDAGAEMLSRGITLTYRRYPFERMEDYLALEAAARGKRQGFWAIPALIKASDRLIQLWEKQRQEAEK